MHPYMCGQVRDLSQHRLSEREDTVEAFECTQLSYVTSEHACRRLLLVKKLQMRTQVHLSLLLCPHVACCEGFV